VVTIAGAGSQTITVTGPNTFTVPSGTPTVGATIFPTTATAQMTWDYTEGDTPETVKYSLNAFAAYRAGAIGTIQNLSNDFKEVWYAPAAAGPIVRQNDGTEALPYQDVDMSGTATVISDLYQTCLVPLSQDPSTTIHFFHGMHMRVFGNGNLAITAFGMDNAKSVVPVASPLALTPTPGKELLVKWFMMNEQQSIAFGTNGIGQWFTMTLIRAYYTEEFAQR
jgi:hypothetical protein